MSVNPIYQRTQLLTGTPGLRALNNTRVAIFGVGGVGSWAAEALVRSGILDITLVDNDVVCITNVNRQLQATTKNVGRSKVAELAERLQTLNPRCKITPVQKVYDPNKPGEFELGSYDYVLDCIDSISCKVDLISRTVSAGTTLYSALGASGKLDPTQIRVASIWETQGHCPLARIIRRRLRAVHFGGDFQAVFSNEPVTLAEQTSVACGTHKCHCPAYVPDDGSEHKDWCATKNVIHGSAVHITASFGMFLSGLVIQDVVSGVEVLPTL
ncbi:MAG: tRNA threonylcarbamoyladenosine dehydratase [Candidatus Krumholzibacteria bacterium]|nr:tRNA threonylcarbamoyladenosine dehydratase [Candidatus Krumholzibacteria bacterium]